MIAHIVLFRPRADLGEAERQEFAALFERTCREVPSVRRAMVGAALPLDIPYVGPFDNRYTYSAVMEFDDQDGLVEYLAHPAHDELARLFWKSCEATAILDVQIVDARTESLAAMLTGTAGAAASKKNS